MKKRYMLFEYMASDSFERVREALFELGVKPLKLVEFNSQTKKGIVRCERGKESALKTAMTKVDFKPIKTSGTIKKLRSLP